MELSKVLAFAKSHPYTLGYAVMCIGPYVAPMATAIACVIWTYGSLAYKATEEIGADIDAAIQRRKAQLKEGNTNVS